MKTKLTELVSSTWRLWVRLSSQAHPLVEIGYGIISTGILYLLPILVGQLAVAAEKRIHLALGNGAQGSISKNSGFIVPRLFEEKRRDIVFGFPSFRPSFRPPPPKALCTLCVQLLLQFYADSFETLQLFLSWSEDMHVVLILS